jgi:hypothetical protein
MGEVYLTLRLAEVHWVREQVVDQGSNGEQSSRFRNSCQIFKSITCVRGDLVHNLYLRHLQILI